MRPLQNYVCHLSFQPAVGKKSTKTPQTSATPGGSKTTDKASASKRKTHESSAQRQSVSVFDKAAMDNLYYVAHSAADALVLCGFGPAPAAGGKSGKAGARKGKKDK